MTKYRHGVLTADATRVLRQAWETVCREMVCTLVEANGEADHVHLLVSYPPKVSLSALENSLKGVSAWRLRAAHLPEVDRARGGEHFWSPSYGAFSTGGAPLEKVNKYIEQQGSRRT